MRAVIFVLNIFRDCLVCMTCNQNNVYSRWIIQMDADETEWLRFKTDLMSTRQPAPSSTTQPHRTYVWHIFLFRKKHCTSCSMKTSKRKVEETKITHVVKFKVQMRSGLPWCPRCLYVGQIIISDIAVSGWFNKKAVGVSSLRHLAFRKRTR